MKPQIITNRDREPAFAVIPYDEYRALMERLEWLEDLRDSKAFEEKLAQGEEEVIPVEVVGRLVEGESPVKVWREHRGLTQVYRADYVECSRTSAPQGRPMTLQREVPSPVSSRRSPFTLCRTKSRDCSPCSRLRKRT